MALTWTILTSRFPSLTGPRSGRDQTFILYSGNVKILKEKGKPTALFFFNFFPQPLLLCQELTLLFSGLANPYER